MKNAVHFYWTINKVLRPALKFCGADFLADNFKFNFATYVYFIGAICAIGSAAYTLTQPDRDKMLKFMSMLGILLQGLSKMPMFYIKTNQLRSKFDYVINMYGQCERNKRDSAIVLLWSRRFQKLCTLFMAIIAFSASTFCSNTIIQFYVFGNMDPIVPFYYPGLSGDTRRSFLILTVIHISFIAFAGIGTLCTDTTIYILALHVCPMSCLLQAKLREINAVVRRPVEEGQTDAHVRDYLHQIIRLHSEFDEYIRDVSKLITITLIGEVFFDAFSMCMIIFLVHMITWIPLYSFFVLFFAKLLAICMLGTVCEHFVIAVADAIRAVQSYRFPLSEQRKFTMMIQRADHTRRLMAGTVILNMETFVSTIKTVYSVAMLLDEMVD